MDKYTKEQIHQHAKRAAKTAKKAAYRQVTDHLESYCRRYGGIIGRVETNVGVTCTTSVGVGDDAR